jgi:hypothetical protein
LQEGNGEGVALVGVWDVGGEAGTGVRIGEETHVGEFPTKNYRAC